MKTAATRLVHPCLVCRALAPSLLLALGMALCTAAPGCEKSSPSEQGGGTAHAGKDGTPANPATGGTKAHDAHDDHAHDDHAHDDHAHDDHGHGEHGNVIELGSTTIGGRAVKVARDEGPLTPGGEGAFDVWIDGDLSTILAVRIWVGTRDAKGSVKVKADPEHSDHPEHRHAHVEIPSPLPDGSQFWVELEVDGGQKHVGGFKLGA